MEPLRVLQFGMTPNPGGVESFIMNYYRKINHKKIQFDFVNMYEKIAYEDEIEELGGNVYKVPHFKKNPIKNYFEIKKIIKENNYNIIHVNMLSAAYIYPILAAKKCKIKCIIAHSHNSSTPPGIVRKILDNFNKTKLKHATHFFACSKKAGKWLFGDINEGKKIKIINNAIDTSKYVYDVNTRKSVRNSLKIKDKFVVGHVGRFQYQKNHEFLIDVFYGVLKNQPNAILLLIGEGDEKSKIIDKVKELGIEDNVIFMGTRSDVNELMQAMDIFLLPSHFEGNPLVAIEAQAAGLKCILSDTITNEVKIIQSVSFMSINNSPDSWINEITKYQNGYKRENAYQKVKSTGYDVDSEVKWMEKFYYNFI